LPIISPNICTVVLKIIKNNRVIRYNGNKKLTTTIYKLKYPEGDELEIPNSLNFNQIVDLNGNPLILPISSPHMIVYRVYKVSTAEERKEITKYYYLELVTGEELFGLASV